MAENVPVSLECECIRGVRESISGYVGYDCEGPCPCNVLPPEPAAPAPLDCGCNPFDVDPVCTGDGETIWNGCQAICQGKEIKCSSECPC